MFKVGDRVLYWNPDYAEHNSTGRVAVVDNGYYWLWLRAWRWPIDAEDSELVHFNGDRAHASASRRVKAWKERGGSL